MATTKKNNMSLAIEEDMQDFLKKHAKANNVSVSKLIRDLIEANLLSTKKITVINHDPEFVPIVLKVPASLRGDREAVMMWLRSRMPGIADRLASQEATHEDIAGTAGTGSH